MAVSRTAEGAQEATRFVASAKTEAERSGEVVQRAIGAMDLRDGVEGLGRGRVVVESAIELLDGQIRIAQLVTGDDRGGVVILGPATRLGLGIGKRRELRLQRVDRFDAAVEPLQSPVIGRAE